MTTLHRVGVVGAGTMGRGIAIAYANAGVPVALTDSSAAALDGAMAAIERHFVGGVAKGRWSRDEADRRLALVTRASSLDALAGVSLVTEAVVEDLAVKRGVFAALDRVTPPDTILATNTSYLDLDALASATARAHLVVGHHYFVPAHATRLLEIVEGPRTAPPVVATSLDVAARLGKVGVVVGNAPGFVGNRLYAPYVRESVFLVEEGATPWEIDRAMVAFGMAMGPFVVQDLSGLDIGWRHRQATRPLRQPGLRDPFAHDLLCERGRFGQKSGAGWYRYGGGRTPEPDPDAVEWLWGEARARGVTRRAIDSAEIVERLVFALVNEGARALEERVARDAADIDLVYVHGYGFPAARGGPMRYAESLGLAHVLARIREFEARFGAHWRPAARLETRARRGERSLS